MPASAAEPALEKAGLTRLSRATQAAILLSEAGHDEKAAATLDVALAPGEPAPPVHRVQALVIRAGLAINMGDWQAARKLLAEMRQIPLQDDELNLLSAELHRADDLEHMLH